MFNKIKDLIDAYKQINSDRLTAKDQLNNIKYKLKEFKNIHNDCKLIESKLSNVYKYCPIDQRKDFIQDTLDFFHHGCNIFKHDGIKTFFGNYSYGWTQKIDFIINYLSNCYDDCYKMYDNRNYKEINERYSNMLEYIDKELYGSQYSYEYIKKLYKSECEK